MRPVSVSGLAAFSEMVVFSTSPTVCLLSGTMLPAKLVISSTELASMTCWRLLFGNFQPFCFDSFAPTSVFFYMLACFFDPLYFFLYGLTKRLNLCVWGFACLAVVDAALECQLVLLYRLRYLWYEYESGSREDNYRSCTTRLESSAPARYWSMYSPSCCSRLLNRKHLNVSFVSPLGYLSKAVMIAPRLRLSSWLKSKLL